MKTCQNCGTVLPDTAKFCRKCGAKLEEIIQEPVFTEATPEEEGTVLIAESAQGMEPVYEEQTQMIPAEQPSPDYEQMYAQQAEAEEETVWDAASADFAGSPGQEADSAFGYGAGTAAGFGAGAAAGFETGAADEGHRRPEGYDRPQEEPYTYTVHTPDWDHTEEFDPKDVSENKVVAMLVYLLGPIGIIIALLASNTSPYAAFHVRQGLKFTVMDCLLVLIAVILCWTIIVPIAAAIFELILSIVKIICFFSICKGNAKEPPIIRSFGFLR